MALADRAELAVRLTLDDRQFAGGIRRTQRSLGGLGKSAGQVGRGVGQIGAGFARAGLIVGGAVAGGLIAAAKAGASFEAQLLTINTIAHASTTDLAGIGDGIRQLAREGRGDLTDLSAAYYDILSAGITDSAEAQGVLTAATTLAIGGLSTNAQAVDLLTTAINAYGQDASAAQADADLFAKSIELGKVTADEIAASFANVAPLAAQQGIEIQEVAAAYAALTAQGVPAAEVTTQMSRAILDLLSPNAELNALQKATGVNFHTLAKDKGLVVALQAMRDAVGGDEQAFKDLFGRVEGYKFALQTTGPQQEIYNDALAAMGNAAGTASAQMGERTKGLAFQVNRLKLNLIDAAITLSEGFNPALARLAEKATTFLSNPSNRESIRNVGREIGAAIDSIDWTKVAEGARAIGDGMKIALGFILTLAQALDKLPTELKAAGAGFLALNKLSGGLIGAGVGNIVGGLAGSAATGLASRAPGLGRLFAQPVFVTNWPLGGIGGAGGAAGGAGGLGLLGGLLGLVGVAAVELAVAEAIAPAYRKLLTGSDKPFAENPYYQDPANQNVYQRARGGVPGGAPIGPAPINQNLFHDLRDPLLAEERKQQAKLDFLRAKIEASRIATVTAQNTAKSAIVNQTRASGIGIQGALRGLGFTNYITVNVPRTSGVFTYRTGGTLSSTKLATLERLAAS